MPSIGDYVRSWDPQPTTHTDDLPPGPAESFAAVVDDPLGGDGELPPMWHWLYFLRWPTHAELGADGHPREGAFMPPVPRRRRMWAGGRLRIHQPLRLGVPARRVSSLADATVKKGRSGELLLVVVRHQVWQQDALCLVEEQDHMYRVGDADANRPPWAPAPTELPTTDLPWQLQLVTDPMLLFRVSALTANTHRIHYDDPYVRQEEGYPGLVVHGPLLALKMLQLVRRQTSARVTSVDYRLLRPLFVGNPALVVGDPGVDGTASASVRSSPDVVHASCTVGTDSGDAPDLRP